jgi:DNA-binding transcriptional ArsR family regulator
MMKKGVEVITAPEKARVLVDPMRREMMRLLAERARTEHELAQTLGLSEPSVGHHLRILREHGLIRIGREEAEEHGILQKFYETTSHAYFIDSRKMPLEIERYFMAANLERARGIVAALNMIKHRTEYVSAKELEEFAEVVASTIVEVASRYAKRWEGDGEEIISRVYRTALSSLQAKPTSLPETVRGLLPAEETTRRSTR